MAYTYDELKKKTVAELRDIAKDIQHDAVKGYSQMNKEHLLTGLTTALSIDTHAHSKVGEAAFDKAAVKGKIQELKKKRDEALAKSDHKQLKIIRSKIHSLKHKMRKAQA
jgi:protein-arginine kinase activator protein McsA